MPAYYNEHDPYAAQWLRNLIKAGHIAPGEVDERSIEDVRPDDLRGFTQCHFFAGIGVWSYALRRAGWPDEREVWTGSCPCQPFSDTGKKGGFDDERHLWPAFDWLIQQRRPKSVFGEQVASKDGLAWLDLVQADMENKGYAFGEIDYCAAGVGSPNIRQRLWFVAERLGNALDEGLEGHPGNEDGEAGRQEQDRPASETGSASRMANSEDSRWSEEREKPRRSGQGDSPQRRPAGHDTGGSFGGMADSNSTRSQQRRKTAETTRHGDSVNAKSGADRHDRPGPTNGFWRDIDWLGCRDGKWRPVKPGLECLADGITNRVGRLRAYGNAINAEVATEVIRAYMNDEQTR